MGKIYKLNVNRQPENTVIVTKITDNFLGWFREQTGFSFLDFELAEHITAWGTADNISEQSFLRPDTSPLQFRKQKYCRLTLSGEGVNKRLHFSKLNGAEKQIHLSVPIGQTAYLKESEAQVTEGFLFLLFDKVKKAEQELNSLDKPYGLVSVENTPFTFINLLTEEPTQAVSTDLSPGVLGRQTITIEPSPGVSKTLGRSFLREHFDLTEGESIQISNEHCELICRRLNFGGDLAYFVRDLHSTNGTFLNNGKLPPDQVFQIQFGDKLRIGSVKLVFQEGKKNGSNFSK